MFDPLGFHEGIPSGGGSGAVEAPSGEGDSREKRLWAFLLVLDTFFLVVFGGVAASMIYLRWSAPSMNALQPVFRRAEPKKIVAPPPTSPAATVAPAAHETESRPAAMVAKPKERRAKEVDAALPAPKGPIGSPGVLSTVLPHESAGLSTPGLAQESATAATPAQRSAPPGKARSIEFATSARHAREVRLKGAFLVRGGGYKDMKKSSDGVWRVKIFLTPGEYHYWFVIDGKKSKQQQVDVQ